MPSALRALFLEFAALSITGLNNLYFSSMIVSLWLLYLSPRPFLAGEVIDDDTVINGGIALSRGGREDAVKAQERAEREAQ